MKNKRLIIFLSTMIILIFSSLLFITYGYVTSEVSGNETGKQFASLSKYMKVEYSDGTNKLGGKSNDYFIPGSVLTKQFKITNTGNMAAKYSIYLNDVVNKFERKEDIIYELYLNDSLIVSDILPTTNSVIAYNQECAIDEILNYTLKIIYKESDENQIVDQGKTISASLDFEKQEAIINNIKLLGNTVQNGTPSLDAPAQILSVGDETENLFDMNDFIETYSPHFLYVPKPSIETFDGRDCLKVYGQLQAEGRAIKYMEGQFKENTQYTFSFQYYDVIPSTATGGIYMYITYTDGTEDVFLPGRKQESANNWYTVNFISDENKTISNIGLTYNNAQPYTYFYDFKIQEGYKIPITVSSRNLIEKKSTSRTIDGVTFTNNPDGSITMNGTNTGTNSIRHTINNIDQNNYIRNIKLEAGTYTLSHQANLPKGIYVQANYVENGTSLYRTSPISFTINENVDVAVYIRFDAGVTADNITIYPQLEKGDKFTEYTPYFESKTSNIFLTEPLSKIDTKYDVLDFKNNTVVRNIKNKLLTGGEDWKLGTPTFNETYLLGYYNNTPSALAAGNGNYSLSDRFVTRTSGISSIDSQFLQIYNNNILIRALKTNFQNELSSDTVDARTAIKNWIGAHPTKVSYITAETFSLNSDKNILPSNLNLYTIPPNANITVGSNIKPTIEVDVK